MSVSSVNGSGHRVVITGLGCVSSLGVGCRAFWKGLSEGRCAIRQVLLERDGLEATFPVAPLSGYDPLEHFHVDQLQIRDLYAQIAVVAAREAMADAGLKPHEAGSESTAVILGSGGGGEHAREEAAVRLFSQRKLRANPMLVPRTNVQASVGLVSMEFGATGPSFVISTGCAASTHAIAQAVVMLRHGLATRAITGGSEAPVMLSVCQAFHAARVVAKDTCRPFSKERSGMTLADAAGIVVLETLEGARKRGARIYGEIVGIGMSADAHSSVHPAEHGPAKALCTALRDGGIRAEDVGYVNAHGTGTQVNDAVETRALKMVFGSHAEKLAVSSTKSMHGHAFGGVGGIELVATVLALENGVLPPTVNYLGPDEDCDLDYVPNVAREKQVDVAVSQSFVFGGLNAVLAVRRGVA